jgi:hypothetical protein
VAPLPPGGRVAPNVRHPDLSHLARRKARAALSGLVLLGACLNPRPEELPSDSQLEPVAPERAPGLQPNAETPGESGAADPAAASPAPNAAPEGAPAFAPAEPPDAGASDAGEGVAADAG